MSSNYFLSLPTHQCTDDEDAFEPKLVFLIKHDDGSFLDASLAPRTKAYLENLVRNDKCLAEDRRKLPFSENGYANLHAADLEKLPCDRSCRDRPDFDCRSVEVPLRYNKEFFQILQLGLRGLNALHGQQRTLLDQEISEVGQQMGRVAHPSKSQQHTDLYAWRAIFGSYIECNIFFSTNERESFARTAAETQTQLCFFSEKVRDLQKVNAFCKRESSDTLIRFAKINADLLRILKFQEINMRAFEKILKSKQPSMLQPFFLANECALEFDKRTSLGARTVVIRNKISEGLSPRVLSQHLAFQVRSFRDQMFC